MLIPFAHADAAQGAAPSLMMQLFPLVIIFVLFYFLLIRPQQKRMKEHQALLAALQKGDEVVTNGGEVGRVVKTSEHYLTVEIADGVEVLLQRGAIASKLDKGTIKANR